MIQEIHDTGDTWYRRDKIQNTIIGYLSNCLIVLKEGPDNVTLEGPVITGEVDEGPDDAVVPYNLQHSTLDDSVTSISSLEVFFNNQILNGLFT